MMNKMRKMKNKKGFTLMEMLIVVAIIAILIAIAIPTFASSLNKARIATDEANIRSGYASVMATVLTDDSVDVEGNSTKAKATYWLNKDGSVTAGAAADNTKAYETKGKTADAKDIAGQSVPGWDKDKKVKYEYDFATNKITITVVA